MNEPWRRGAERCFQIQASTTSLVLESLVLLKMISRTDLVPRNHARGYWSCRWRRAQEGLSEVVVDDVLGVVVWSWSHARRSGEDNGV